MKRLALLVLAALLLLIPLAAACGDDNGSNTPTVAATSTVASPVTTAPSATPSVAATSTPGSTASPASTPPADGTVDPLGAGQQTPWTIKGIPEATVGVVTVTALRMGLHPELGGWERIVFEFQGTQLPPATIQYVNQATSCGSGQPVAVNGNAILEVAITNAQAHDDGGHAMLTSPAAGPGGTVINQGVSSCDFEGHVTWDFGLNGKHNFKVTTLTNPVRLVIDIKD